MRVTGRRHDGSELRNIGGVNARASTSSDGMLGRGHMAGCGTYSKAVGERFESEAVVGCMLDEDRRQGYNQASEVRRVPRYGRRGTLKHSRDMPHNKTMRQESETSSQIEGCSITGVGISEQKKDPNIDYAQDAIEGIMGVAMIGALVRALVPR